MERLAETLGITRLSVSQVSMTARELDEQVESFRTRPLDGGMPLASGHGRRRLSDSCELAPKPSGDLGEVPEVECVKGVVERAERVDVRHSNDASDLTFEDTQPVGDDERIAAGCVGDDDEHRWRDLRMPAGKDAGCGAGPGRSRAGD